MPVAAYMPQENGRAKGIVQAMKSAIRKVSDSSKQDWDSKLRDIECGYRRRKYGKYDTSPFQVIFGIEESSVQDAVLFQEVDHRSKENEDQTVGECDMEARESQLMAVEVLRAERKTSRGDYTSNPSLELENLCIFFNQATNDCHRWYRYGSALSS